MNANEQFAAAIRHLQAGRAADAESLCRTILAAAPDHADSLHLLGILAHQADRNAAAVEHLRKAIALNDRVPQCHFNIAPAYFALGRLQDAKGHYQRALALNPNYAEAHNNLGSVLLTQGRPDEAIAQFQRSLALKPSLFEAQINFGKALLAKGSMEAALSVLVRALEARDAPETKALIVACLRHMTSLPPGIDADSILVRAISEPWGRPDDLLQVTTGLLKSSPVLGECIARAAKAWPARLSAEDLYARPGLAAVAGSRVLRCLLESVAIADVELERFLTSARSALLQIASSTAASIPEDEHMLGFACSLARQCFINDYVFDLTTDERDHARQLQATIAAALAAGAAIPALRLVAVAAYVPLHAVAQAERLLDMSWPEPVTGVLVQQIREPQDEKRRRGTIAALTEISGDVSERVARQYEESPFPPWVKTATVTVTSLERSLRGRFPLVPFQSLDRDDGIDVLVAGCGTGQHAIETALQLRGARVLAIDLSLTSLCYAQRKADAMGLSAMEFAQADILRLGTITRRFDLIESVGVLHHLEDPWTGWRTLLSLLRPGGFMRIGLYSRLARQGVSAARTFIAKQGYHASDDDIRQCRQDLIALDERTPLRNVTRTPDFFTISACRDLLFHVQEHQMTLPEIKTFLTETGLHFLGFEAEPDVSEQYRKRFPADDAMTDLDNWHRFETDRPDSFFGMYQFVVQRPAA